MKVPLNGVTPKPLRLTYPAVFRSKTQAERFAADNHLGQAGVNIVQIDDGSWRCVIDTRRAPQIGPWLRMQYPGITWAVDYAP